MKSARSTPTDQVYPGPAWQWNNWSNHPAQSSLFQKLIRAGRRRKRLLAALLLCLAAALTVQQLSPPAAATEQVLLSVRDLPAGHTLSLHDVKTAAVAADMVPDGAFSLEPSRLGDTASPQRAAATNAEPGWVGRQLSGPLRRGEVLTDASLLGDELLIGSPPGTQAVPVRVSDPATLSLLSQGQLVTVVLSRSETLDGPMHNEVLAESVPVLWTPELAPSGGGMLPAQNVEGMVVVAASAAQALQLAGAISHGKVFLILVPQTASKQSSAVPG